MFSIQSPKAFAHPPNHTSRALGMGQTHRRVVRPPGESKRLVVIVSCRTWRSSVVPIIIIRITAQQLPSLNLPIHVQETSSRRVSTSCFPGNTKKSDVLLLTRDSMEALLTPRQPATLAQHVRGSPAYAIFLAPMAHIYG